MDNKDIEITLLSKKEIDKDENKKKDVLDIFKNNDVRCSSTDLAIATGAFYLSGSNICDYWTKSRGDYFGFYSCDVDEDLIDTESDLFSCALRPVLDIKNQEIFDKITANKRINEDGVYEVEFGEYPQYAPNVALQKELDSVKKRLKKTGKEYTFATDSETEYFEPDIHIEYEYNENKYIQIEVATNFFARLSNGADYSQADLVWLWVSPVTWLVDEKTKKLVSKNALLGGIPMYFKGVYTITDDFNDSNMKDYLDRYMLHDLTQSVDLTKLVSEEKAQKRNPYGFDFEKVKEEDIIMGAIESDVPVFLHGQSSDGKSARVKQIDSDCIIIYMRNATPESLVGKSVYDPDSKELIDIKPTWLVKLEDKCKAEPDKNHIVFFDEISNALPSVQGMAFNVILDREVNGKWNLPENARIVAAGNELKDSLAANRIAEPLFNRFAHVYINTNFKDWLIWASENNIHPAICAYIAFTNGDALRTEYNGETPNADPRKWEMASKMLYKSNNPEMVRSLVGEEVTADFVKFCKQRVITLDDVLNDNYTDEDIRSLDTAERYATAMALSGVDDENIEKVRKVVEKLGREIVATFDMMWAKGLEERLEKIAEIKIAEQSRAGDNNKETNDADKAFKKRFDDKNIAKEKWDKVIDDISIQIQKGNIDSISDIIKETTEKLKDSLTYDDFYSKNYKKSK